MQCSDNIIIPSITLISIFCILKYVFLLSLLRIFGLLTSSFLLYSQRFGWCVLWPSSGVSCWTWELIIESWIELFIWTTGVECSNSVNHDWIQVLSYSKYSLLVLPVVGIEPATTWGFYPETLSNQTTYPLHHVSLLDNKDDVNSPNILSKNNYHASSQKFRQMFLYVLFFASKYKASCQLKLYRHKTLEYGDTCSAMVIVVGNGHSNPSSNPVRGCLHFTKWQYLLEKYVSYHSSSCFMLYSRNTNIYKQKHNLRTSVNERIHFFIKNISLTLYSREGDVCCM